MPHFDAERKIELQQLGNRLHEIFETIYSPRQGIANVEIAVTGPGKGPERAPTKGWKAFPVSERPRWGGYDQTTWFRMTVEAPAAWKGERVVALIRPSMKTYELGIEGLSKGAEALAYLDGVPYQGLDFNRDELLLVERAKGGERFEIALEAVPSTRFDVYHQFAYADLAVKNDMVWEFYWNAAVALGVCETLDANSASQRRLQQLLTDAVWNVDLQRAGEAGYGESIRKAQRFLSKGLKELGGSHGMGSLTLTGHAHIDTAWLWPLRETKRKCARTFSTVLNLMECYPEFHFSCSQPAQYEYIKEHYPEIYERITKRVKEGRWECCGAPYIEPDCNVPSGESLVRQFLFGNRFFEREFGVRSRLAWQPDAFGYTWQLPQIMRKAGLDAFVTTKIDWSEYTEFPYSLFWWEGADGSRILTIMPPLNYNGNPVPQDLVEQWDRFKQKEHVDELPFPFGWGDGGGGPTMGMIEHGKRLSDMPGIPKCRFGTNRDSVKRMRDQMDDDKLPVWNGELYLELHRGCQTSQARVKRGNRKSEVALRDAEFLGVLSLLNGGSYDQERLEQAWKKVLLNQFHDILPGSSITEVYTDAERDYDEAFTLIDAAKEEHLKVLFGAIDTAGEGTPIVVFNSLGWTRDDVAEIATDLPKGAFSVLDPSGRAVPAQKVGKNRLLFEAAGVPPLGYAVYRLVRGKRAGDVARALRVSGKSMENDFIRVRFDTKGRLISIYDKVEERETVPKGARGNVLQFFDDRPAMHEAWDIDHNIDAKMWELGSPELITVQEEGPVRGVVRMVWKIEHSTITQEVTLYGHAPRVDFVTHVDWWEKRTLLKAAFPVDVRATRATYETAFGVTERPTHDNTAHDRARHEVAGHRWGDLSEGDYGVSILNDCKYGWDARGNVMRLSLLRSPIDPDPTADEGEHRFTYSVYPHGGDWRNGTVHQGMELNAPLLAYEAPHGAGALPSVDALASVEVENVFVDTVKKAEDSDAVVVRVYEGFGQRGAVTLVLGRRPRRISECDLMEENEERLKLDGSSLRFYVRPFEIRTFLVVF